MPFTKRGGRRRKELSLLRIAARKLRSTNTMLVIVKLVGISG